MTPKLAEGVQAGLAFFRERGVILAKELYSSKLG